jgi:hypothetical protein
VINHLILGWIGDTFSLHRKKSIFVFGLEKLEVNSGAPKDNTGEPWCSTRVSSSCFNRDTRIYKVNVME